MSFKAQGIAILGIATVVAYSYGDRYLNYVETPASISKVKVECYVKSDHKHLEDRRTGEMAYMDCEIAPLAAAKFGYDDSAIHHRVSIEYQYTSPVDGTRQNGKYTDDSAGKDEYAVGKSITVYAHKETPEESRFR